MPDYRTLALQQLDPQYNAKVQALKNATASQLQNLDQSKGGVNQNFDLQVDNQNLNNTKSKNNYSNTMLGRSLGRSSIVGTGLAEQDQINNRLINQINTARTGALNNIDQQKALMQNNTDSTIGQMQGDKESELAALIRQLQDRDWDKNFKQKEFDTQTQMNNDRFNWEKQTQAAEQAFREKQFQTEQANKVQELALARQKANQPKEPSKADMQNAYYNKFKSAIANKDVSLAESLIYDDQEGIIKDLGRGFWNQLNNEFWKWQTPSAAETKAARQYLGLD